MPSDLLVALEGGAAVFEVHGTEDGVFAVAAFDVEDGGLEALFVGVIGLEVLASLFEGGGVGEEVELFEDFFVDVGVFINHVVGGDGDSASEKVWVDGAMKNIKGAGDEGR